VPHPAGAPSLRPRRLDAAIHGGLAQPPLLWPLRPQGGRRRAMARDARSSFATGGAAVSGAQRSPSRTQWSVLTLFGPFQASLGLAATRAASADVVVQS